MAASAADVVPAVLGTRRCLRSIGAEVSTSGEASHSGPVGATPESADEALEALLDELGAFGWYQRYVLVLLCLPNLLGACYSLSHVFVAAEVPFR